MRNDVRSAVLTLVDQAPLEAGGDIEILARGSAAILADISDEPLPAQDGESAAAGTNATTTDSATATATTDAAATDAAATGDGGGSTAPGLTLSGLIATNGKELAALRALGERNYTEFKLGKTKGPQRVGDIAVFLKKTDPKKNKYTIDVIADDKTVEKKDKGVNEPVQFIVSRASQPYELIVNEVRKDMIVGYVAAPKVQTPRN